MDAHAREVERRLEVPLLIFALLTIPAIVIEQSSTSAPWDTVAAVLNWSIWLAFVAEVVVMLRVVPNRRAWLRDHPLDLAIVLFTPPFLPATLQAARVFRLLRLTRLLKAGVLMRRLLSTEGVRDAAVLALMTILVGGTAFATVEKGQHLSAWDGVWWSLTTVTTVGYGDIKVQTDAGRVIAIVVMLVGTRLRGDADGCSRRALRAQPASGRGQARRNTSAARLARTLLAAVQATRDFRHLGVFCAA